MKKKDIIMVFIVILVSLAALFFSKIFTQSGDIVKITLNGEVYCEKNLYENTEIQIDGTNTAIIENGEVYMDYASCPDGLCIRQGKISDSSKKIICLPNKVVIEITKKSEIDMVVK